MPSRQERRKAERDAAKRAPARAAAAGAAGAAAAFGNVDPGGDWTTQSEDPVALLESLGDEILKQKADAGDKAAQFSQGCLLVYGAGADDAGLPGATGGPPSAQVGWHFAASRRSPDRDASTMVT